MRRLKLHLAILLLMLWATQAGAEPVFSHDLGEGPKPWTNKTFGRDPNTFTFAVFGDITGGERKGIFDITIAQLNLLRPEFIISVGDLIEGDDDPAEVTRQWDEFDARASKAKAPMFYVGGNHDLLGETLQNAWRERYGPNHYHFVYQDVLFLVLDTDDHDEAQLAEIATLRTEALEVARTQGWDAFYKTPYFLMAVNTGGNIRQEQSDAMVAAIEANPNVRHTFVFAHKAPWLRDDHEPFLAIERALAGRDYTVFHGHEHAYQYEQRGGQDYIRLATSGGVFLPQNGRSMDHVVLVTVDDEGVDIANLLMAGILDKTGRIPLDGDDRCLEANRCGDQE